MRLVFLGPPGAGKGTLAVRLAEEFSLAHIATGDLLREEVKLQTELGRKAKAILERGALVPDDLVIEIVKKRLEKSDVENGFILDGFPRTEGQAEALDRVLSQSKLPLDMVVDFETSEKTIVDRLNGRRNCPNCGMNFHIRNLPPKREGICDRCGEKLVQRKDDNAETIRHRLEVYEKETAPLIRYYEKKGLLRKTSGDLQLPDQLDRLHDLLEELAH